MATDFAGLVLNNRYEISRLLGEGGMGLVLLAHDTFLDREVAVKIIQPADAWSDEAIQDFITEARIIARLEHPHVVNVYDLGTQLFDGVSIVYIVMRLATGGTLEDRLLNSGPVSFQEAARILMPICEAVDYAHQQGVIHLDLKPLNILFDHHGSPLVADFGLAKGFRHAAKVKADTKAGTMEYMPPEQLFGAEAGPYSDVYALGITLYEMLTGDVPSREWDATLRFENSLPDAIQVVIERATQPNPQLRYHTATELALAYQSALQAYDSTRLRSENRELEALYTSGLSHYDTGEIDAAIADYNAALHLSPQDPEIFFHRGIAHAERGDLENAIADLSNAISLNPHDVDGYFYRGLAYRRMKDFLKANEDFTQVLRLDSQNADAYYQRGIARNKHGDLEGAIADFSEVIHLSPQCADAYYRRGNARNKQGDLEEAVADYNTAIHLNHQHIEAYYLRGDARYQRGDLAGAIEDFTAAIRLNPEHAEAYYLRGSAHYQQGEYDKAIADFSAAIRLAPEHAEAYYLRGHAYGKQGQMDSAIADFSAAIALNPQDAEASYYRGLANARQRDLDSAIADFSAAIRLNPHDAEAYWQLGDCYYDLKHFEDALSCYERYLELVVGQPNKLVLQRIQQLRKRKMRPRPR